MEHREHAGDKMIDGHRDQEPGRTSRRVFIAIGLGMFATGCAKSPRTISRLPGPIWPDLPVPELPPDTTTRDPAPKPRLKTISQGVISRANWAKGKARPAMMNRMIPIRYITVHHDGMDPFFGDSRQNGAERLELIRRSHRNRGWGDIGYHFVIDRGGRVWEARSLAYQGAHVKDHNEGNIGVMAMGNFDQQAPTVAQLKGLNRHVSALMGVFNIPVRYVRTHQEWAETACPGHSLQRHMDTVRSNHQL